MKAVKLLKTHLMPLLPINQTRITFIAQFVLALIDAQSSNLNTLSLKFKGRNPIIKGYSASCAYTPWTSASSPKPSLNSSLFPPNGFSVLTVPTGSSAKLTSTSWSLVSHTRARCIPLFWSLLPKRGYSNTQERIDLMNRLFKLFPLEHVDCVTAVREFIGRRWLIYLKAHGIPFRIRICNNGVRS